MSLPHVILMFVGGPLLVMAIAYGLAYLMSRDTASAGTYKLGDTWEREPLWFVGQPREGVAAHLPQHALETAHEPVPSATMVGGASGTW
ncbi:hypothetical protein [Blastococcus sp. Marseille-P5729]|uniref:aa3-type cytochrome oxidase subunit CtaJ n=1 Tax=Blastococcus sp. Marseille-P5729 TaxID=2086582 RepID=UPI000D0FAE25|nr:hypothetical protein [Blastococcus sp. Marseille-P5729]